MKTIMQFNHASDCRARTQEKLTPIAKSVNFNYLLQHNYFVSSWTRY